MAGLERRPARGSGLWLFVRREDPAQVMDSIPFRKLAPRQCLGRGVWEGILLLVMPKLATPQGIDYDMTGARLRAICSACPALTPPDAKSDGTEKVRSRSGI